jgi:hypothetical protein
VPERPTASGLVRWHNPDRPRCPRSGRYRIESGPRSRRSGPTTPLSRTPNKQLDPLPRCLVDWPIHSIAVTVAHAKNHPSPLAGSSSDAASMRNVNPSPAILLYPVDLRRSVPARRRANSEKRLWPKPADTLGVAVDHGRRKPNLAVKSPHGADPQWPRNRCAAPKSDTSATTLASRGRPRKPWAGRSPKALKENQLGPSSTLVGRQETRWAPAARLQLLAKLRCDTTTAARSGCRQPFSCWLKIDRDQKMGDVR